MDRFLLSKATVSKETESGASKKRRKYDHEYLNFGFSWTGSEDAPLPVCCFKEALANDAMRPCRLRRHIETKHPSLVTKPREFFDRKVKWTVVTEESNPDICVPWCWEKLLPPSQMPSRYLTTPSSAITQTWRLTWKNRCWTVLVRAHSCWIYRRG